MDEVKKINLRSGKVEVTGVADDMPVTLTGDIEDVRIGCVSNRAGGWELSPSQYYLKFKPDDDGKQFTWRLKGIEVVKEASIEAYDRTVAALEKARERAGAPENAKVLVAPRWGGGELVVQDLDTPNPIMVTFRWKEVVYK